MAYTYGASTYAKINGSDAKKYEVRVGYEAQNYNIANNTTPVNAVLQVRTIDSSYGTWGIKQTSNLGGVAFEAKTFSVREKNTWVTFASTTLTITHKSDGTYSGTLEGSFTTNGTDTYTLKSGSASVDMTLPTIPRATTPTISSSTITMGSSATITLIPASSTFKHKLKYSFGGVANLTDGLSIGSNYSPSGSTTIAFTPPTSLGNYIPASTGGHAIITCTTYDANGTQIGEPKTITVTLNVPSYTPTVSIAIKGNDLLGGVYVQGKSTATYTITANGKHGSTIQTYTSKLDGITYSGSSFTTNVLSNGTKVLSVTVVDSRGRTATVNAQSINVEPYTNPSITSFTADRSSDETTVVAKMTGSIASVGGKNTSTLSISLNGVTKTVTSGSSVTFTGLSTELTYTAVAKITDAYTTVSKSVSISTVYVTLDFNASGKGIAVGKVSEKDAFEVDMPVEVLRNLDMKGNRILNAIVEGYDPSGTNDYEHPMYDTREDGLEGNGIQLDWGSNFDVVDTLETENGHVTVIGKERYKLPSNVATSIANGLMSKEDKDKLEGIEAGANKYVHPEYETAEEVLDNPVSLSWGSTFDVVDALMADNGHIVEIGKGRYKLPSSKATSNKDGLMSSTDKVKLDSFGDATTYALKTEVAKDYAKVEHTHSQYLTEHQDLSDYAKKTDIPTDYAKDDHTHDGLMSSEERTKLDGIEAGAEKNVVTKVANNGDSASTTGVNITTSSGTVYEVAKIVKGGKIHANVLPLATTTVDGAMTSADKTKLDSIQKGAEKNLFKGYRVQEEGQTEVVPYYLLALLYEGTSEYTYLRVPMVEDGKVDSDVLPLATTSENGAMSSTDKAKLDSVETNANNYVHPSHTAKANGFYKVTVDNKGHVSNVEAVTKDDITKLGIPSQDTVYTHPTHTAKGNGLYKVTVDEQGHVSGTSSVTKSDITSLGIPAQDTTYVEATTSSSGLMSPSDKTKLNNIENEAEANLVNDVKIDGKTILKNKVAELPLANGDSYGVVKVERDGSIVYVYGDWHSTGKNWYAVPSLVTDGNDSLLIDPIYLPLATTEKNGAISKSDKAKLDGIEANANKVVVENVLTSTSTVNALSALQGKVLDEKIKAINTNLEDLGAGDMLKSIYDIDGDGIVDDAKRVNGHTIQSDVPANAKFTDTTYTNATTSSSGLMSATDKTKLNGIEEEAQKNVITDAGIRMNGDVPLSAIFIKDDGSEIEVPALDSTYKIQTTLIPKVTTTADGLMKKQDKAKLDAFGDASTYALKSEISRVFKYISSVNTADDLPTSNSVGDVYNILEASQYGGAGMNVVYTGTGWDALGEAFTIEAITTSFIDSICV